MYRVAVLALLLLLSVRTDASVHSYGGEKFAAKGNAFVVHGGSEGIYSSAPIHNDTSAAANGDSYIRSFSFHPFTFHTRIISGFCEISSLSTVS